MLLQKAAPAACHYVVNVRSHTYSLQRRQMSQMADVTISPRTKPREKHISYINQYNSYLHQSQEALLK